MFVDLLFSKSEIFVETVPYFKQTLLLFGDLYLITLLFKDVSNKKTRQCICYDLI